MSAGYTPQAGCWYHTAKQEWRFDERRNWERPGFEQTEAHPVTCLTFEDAQAYAAWISQETGQRYRLPTDAEFEFFNRSGRTGSYGYDIDRLAELCEKANGADHSTGLPYGNQCTDGFAETAPVASFAPNAFGLYDTTGNLWELTTECWQSDYTRVMWRWIERASSGRVVRRARTCPGRHTVRGGAFLSSPANLAVDMREIEGERSNRVGFRVVRDLQ